MELESRDQCRQLPLSKNTTSDIDRASLRWAWTSQCTLLDQLQRTLGTSQRNPVTKPQLNLYLAPPEFGFRSAQGALMDIIVFSNTSLGCIQPSFALSIMTRFTLSTHLPFSWIRSFLAMCLMLLCTSTLFFYVLVVSPLSKG